MDIVKDYLESSTIHGLVYISTAKKLRLFWIFVVLASFSYSSLTIYNSFQSWADNPISTTIEIKSIADLKLPKVTVCPPKNTFTNLNYDIVKSKGVNMNNHTKTLTLNTSKMIMQEIDFENAWEDQTSFLEKDKFQNRYDGVSVTDFYKVKGFNNVARITTYAQSDMQIMNFL